MKTQLKRRVDPKQSRGQKTIDLILNSAAELLDEVGLDRLSTNMVCEKAGLTPPALYRYFPNKYAILAELGERLMELQNKDVRLHFFRILEATEEEVIGLIHEVLKDQLRITEEEPGGRWILRSLHAVPSLCDIRTRSHDLMAIEMTEAAQENPLALDREQVLLIMRLNIEIGYSIIEYLLDDPKANRELVLQDTAELIARRYLRCLG